MKKVFLSVLLALVASVNVALAQQKMTMSEMMDSVAVLEKELSAAVAKHGENHADVADIYVRLGVMRNNMSLNYKAKEDHGNSLRIYLALYGEAHPSVAKAYEALGNTKMLLKDAACVNDFRTALEIFRKVYGEQHERTVQACVNLGILSLNYDDAEAYRMVADNLVMSASVASANSFAARQGLSGEYYLLALNDWDLNSSRLFFRVFSEIGPDAPKTFVLMKDGVISQHHFEDSVGLEISVKHVIKEERKRIVEAYAKWKHK